MRLDDLESPNVTHAASVRSRYVVPRARVDQQCTYESADSPCAFCQRHGNGEGCKKAGPKTVGYPVAYQMNERVGQPLYKAVSDYDASITGKEVHFLQSLYREAQQENNRQTRLMQLVLKLAVVFGPSMSHSTLRLAICAWVTGWLFTNHPDREMYRWAAIEGMRRRLGTPSELDEGDLFATGWLTLLSGVYARDLEFISHFTGFAAMARHLESSNRLNSHILSPLWPLLRDEMILYGLDYFLGGHGSIMNTVLYSMCLPSSTLSGRNSLPETRKFQAIIGDVTSSAFSVDGLVATTWQQYVLLHQCIQLRTAPEGSEHKVENNVMSLTQIVRMNLAVVDDARLLVEMEDEMKAIWDRFPGNPFYPLHIATGILWLLLCRLLLVVLEAQSYSLGLRTPDGLAAVTHLGQIIAQVEKIAMCRPSDLSDSSSHKTVPENFVNETGDGTSNV